MTAVDRLAAAWHALTAPAPAPAPERELALTGAGPAHRPGPSTPGVLAHLTTARAALSAATHPSTLGRYAPEARASLHATLRDAQTALAAAEHVLDTHPGPSIGR